MSGVQQEATFENGGVASVLGTGTSRSAGPRLAAVGNPAAATGQLRCHAPGPAEDHPVTVPPQIAGVIRATPPGRK
jgi:hypothetical protein